MQKFKVTMGTHQEAGRVYKSGQTLETNTELHKMFPGKFQLLDGSPASSQPPMPPVQPPAHPYPPIKADKAANTTAEQSKATGKPEGRDVTKQFPKAVEEDFKVFKLIDGLYNVYDVDDQSKPCNNKPIPKAEIDIAIRSAMAGAQ